MATASRSISLDEAAIFADQRDIKADVYLNIGGRYAGRTWGTVINDVFDLTGKPGFGTVAIRETYASIHDSIYKAYLSILTMLGLAEGMDYKAQVSPLSIKFYNGSEVIFRGADKPSKMKGLERCHKAIFEEADSIPLEVYDSVDMSLRGQGYPNSKWLNCNPWPKVPGFNHWIEQKWMLGREFPLGENHQFTDKANGEIVNVCKSTYKHNAFCPPKVRAKLEGYKDTNPPLYRMWALGEIIEVEGLIFKYDTVPAVPDGAELLGYGLDFGFSSDPSAVLGVWQAARDLYLVPLVYSTGLTNPNLSAAMTAAMIPQSSYIVPDSARPDSIQELVDLGWSNMWPVHKAPNYKADVVNVLQGYNLHVVETAPRFRDMVKELATYAWATNKQGDQLNPPRPQDGNDHLMDCLVMVAREKLGKETIMQVPDVDAALAQGAW